MGQPNNYSTDIPNRCFDLLELLLPVVQSDEETASRHGGALTTTFTLALATPMLVLPIERIQKHFDEEHGYANDRRLSKGLADRIDAAVMGKKLNNYPELAELDWAYTSQVEPFNIAYGISDELADKLNSEQSHTSAKNMEFAAFLSCLRNSLSHGGIIYLDEHGKTSYGQASILCFVSARQERERFKCDQREDYCPTVIPRLKDLRLLRISEKDFRQFLARWVQWLGYAGLQALAAE